MFSQGSVCSQEWESDSSSCCGRYASYLNAFLFSNIFGEDCMRMKEFRRTGAYVLEHPLDPPLHRVANQVGLKKNHACPFQP